MPDKYLITGGAGFIGSNLANHLIEHGQEVVVLDNFSTGKHENIDELRQSDQCRLIIGDVRDAEILLTAMQDCRAVFHLAALGSVPRSLAEPLTVFDVNVRGTVNVLECARQCNINRIVFASSGSVYGGQLSIPMDESVSLLPSSPYAASKSAAEAYMVAYSKSYEVETVTLRYFNVFGPRQDLNRSYPAVIPSFIKSIMQGKQPTIYGDGEQTRDFCHVENVCHATWLAAHALPGCCDGLPINIGSGESHTVNDIFIAIKKQLDLEVEPEYLAIRPGDVKYSIADISLAREKFGYMPCKNFADGLEATIKWYVKMLRTQTA